MVPADIPFRCRHFKQAVSSDSEQQLPLFPMSISASAPAHDPGGKIRLALKGGVTGTAQFGGVNQEYRYRLTRVWDDNKPCALVVMMNPSTADPKIDDPTAAKCSV